MYLCTIRQLFMWTDYSCIQTTQKYVKYFSCFRSARQFDSSNLCLSGTCFKSIARSQITYTKLQAVLAPYKKKGKHKKKTKPKYYEELIKVLETHEKHLGDPSLRNVGECKQTGFNIQNSSFKDLTKADSTETLKYLHNNSNDVYNAQTIQTISCHESTVSQCESIVNMKSKDLDNVISNKNLTQSIHCNSSNETSFYEPEVNCLETVDEDAFLSSGCDTMRQGYELEMENADLPETDSELLLSSGPDFDKNNKEKKKRKKAVKYKTETAIRKETREKLAKVKAEELEKQWKETNLSLSLKAFIDVCFHSNMFGRAHSVFLYYRFKSKSSNSSPKVVRIELYNALLSGWARKGNINKIIELFTSMREDCIEPSLQSYAAFLECLARQKTCNMNEVENILCILEKKGFKVEDIFAECKFSGDQMEKVVQAICNARPTFTPVLPPYNSEYNCLLLENLKYKEPKPYSPCEDTDFVDNLRESASQQIECETKCLGIVKSINVEENPTSTTLHLRTKLEQCEKEWRVTLTDSFKEKVKILSNQFKTHSGLSLYPYLTVLDPQYYVDILLQEIDHLAESSENFSLSVTSLHRNVGAKVMTRYFTWAKQKNGVADKMTALYYKYLEYYTTPDLTTKYYPREYWELLKRQYFGGPTLESDATVWPHHILLGVGRFLYDILLHDVQIDVSILSPNSSSGKKIPAFYTVYRWYGTRIKEEVKPHPCLAKLYRGAAREYLKFDANLMPMLSPPLPWTSFRTGGFILCETPFIRLSELALQQRLLLEKTPNQNLYPSFDALNFLGFCPWVINKQMLDIVLEVFQNKGNDELDIPKPASESPQGPQFVLGMTKLERYRVGQIKKMLKRKKMEMHSLWCDTLYKLSLANHFRDKVFWFPHNMDFRGRVYPTPPHFNHLGGDMVRSILLFAQGKPLGRDGFDWLKIHLINLTGMKKRDSLKDRLRFANEIMPEILDSADNPFSGNGWWMKSDEPWQTLAICKEIANVYRSPDPTKYVSQMPVHQDGSCNGLQHYAALGRDQEGAEQVNLYPSSVPQDVYSGVAALVERERAKDAEEGLKIAQILDGFIKRKVVKQTVMTVVYGVTRYGARLQILKQLNDISNFPQEQSWAASTYLVNKTFLSIQEMFTATKKIQDWFSDCARLISQVCGQPVEWVTPLGLPVVQPYHRACFRKGPFSPEGSTQQYKTHWDMFMRPNVLKQKNAFPPNFIHSLDSCHMMLTTLHCTREGIVFVSVHDCYWAHACNIDEMNRICREQFVALHNEPILDNLSKFLLKKYGYTDGEVSCNEKSSHMKRLNRILVDIPTKGNFLLENVLKSTYFFS